MTRTKDITAEIQDKLYNLLSQNLPKYENGKMIDVEHNYYISEFLCDLEAINLYAERIKEFKGKADDRRTAIKIIESLRADVSILEIDEILKQYGSATLTNLSIDKTTISEVITGLEGQINVYERAVTLLHKLIVDQMQDNIKHSKARYKAEQNIYNSRNYVEYPLSLLGYNNDNKTIFGCYYSNIRSLENNKKYLFSKIKDNEYLRNEFINLFFPNLTDKTVEEQEQYLNKNCKEDMYFETFLNATDKTELIKQNTEFTNLAVSDTAKSTADNTYLLLGGARDEEVKPDHILTGDNKKIQELLNPYSVDK